MVARTLSLLALMLPLLACEGVVETPGPRDFIGGAPRECEAPPPATVRARRLTGPEQQASLTDALGVTPPDALLPGDETRAGFLANVSTDISERQLAQQLELAEWVAEQAIASGAVPTCATGACLGALLDGLGRDLYRRPLSTDERDALLASAAEWRADTSDSEVVAALLSTLLLSPGYLYVVERGEGEPREDGALRLDGFSLAGRLAFTLTGRAPDAALLDAATLGTLETPEGLAHEADRLLAREGTDAHIAGVLAQWMELDRIEEADKDPELYAFWSDEVAASMRAEAEAFLLDVVQRDAGVSGLLTSSEAFLDANTAPLHGLPAPAAGELEQHSLPETRRGLMTLPAWLAGRAHAREPSWVLRGLFVRHRLLCETLPPPPANVDLTAVAQGSRLDHPVCGTCHTLIDPIGGAFDRYDAAGLPSGEEPGGRLVSADPQLEGRFDSIGELSERLAASEAVHQCMARTAFRFAHRRDETSEEGCAADAMGTEWQEEGGGFRDLLRRIVLDENFRWARMQEPQTQETE